MTVRAIDLACGCGGWACAARGLPIAFVAVADLAADCRETWQLNHGAAHPGCAVLPADLATKQGMRQVLRAAGKVDLVLGAIPCEPLSTARANRPLKPGELEAVHALIDSCFAAVKQLRPRWWCFEDVSAVEGHLPPPLDCGMPYECRRLQAADYGPQKRRRTFFGRYPPPAPPEPGPRVLADVLRPGPYRTLPQLAQYERTRSKWYGQGGVKQLRVQDAASPGATVISSQGSCGSNAERSGMVPVEKPPARRVCRVNEPQDPAPTVMNVGSQGPSGERGFLVPLARVLDAGEPCPTVADFGSRHERAALVPTEAWPRSCDRPMPADQPSRTVADGGGGGKGLPVRQPLGRERAQATEEPSRTVDCTGLRDGAVDDGGLVRVLEWQEAARLQGFPPDYVFAASWSRTWKLVAQAIPIQVGRAILQAIVQESQG